MSVYSFFVFPCKLSCTWLPKIFIFLEFVKILVRYMESDQLFLFRVKNNKKNNHGLAFQPDLPAQHS